MEAMTPSGLALVLVIKGFVAGVLVYFVTWCVKGAGHLSKLWNPSRT